MIALEGVAAEREDFRAVVLKGCLAEAVRGLNLKLPESAVEVVVHVVTKPDLVWFVNGLPLALIELKNLADQQADVWVLRRIRLSLVA